MDLKPTYIDPDNPSQLREPRANDTFINEPDVSFDNISDLTDYKIGQSPRTKSANVMGYYSAGDGGGGTFYWDSSEAKSNHNGGTVINPDHNSTIGSSGWYSSTGDATDDSGSGCWKRMVKNGYYFVDDFGAVGDAVSDDFNAIDNTIKSAPSFSNIIFANRKYVCNSQLNPKEGQVFKGISDSGIRNDNGTYLTSSLNDYLFTFQVGTGKTVYTCPQFQNIEFECSFGIELGDETTALPADDIDSQNYLRHGHIKNCSFIGPNDGTGVAIKKSVDFRGVIESCEIRGYDIGIQMWYSDLCTIQDTRVSICYTSLIDLKSSSVAGTQTYINHCDLLTLKDGADSFIRTQDKWTLIKNNYFEQTKDNITSIINIESGGATNKYVYIRDNRVGAASDNTQYFVNCNHSNFALVEATDNYINKGPILKDNNFPNRINQWESQSNRRIIRFINSPSQGLPYNSSIDLAPQSISTANNYSYEKNYNKGFVLNPSIGTGNVSGGDSQEVEVEDGAWVITNNGDYVYVSPSPFRPSGEFKAYVLARADNDGDEIYVGFTDDTVNATLKNLSLTTDWVLYEVGPVTKDNLVMSMRRVGSNNTGDCYVRQIYIEYTGSSVTTVT